MYLLYLYKQNLAIAIINKILMFVFVYLHKGFSIDRIIIYNVRSNSHNKNLSTLSLVLQPIFQDIGPF